MGALPLPAAAKNGRRIATAFVVVGPLLGLTCRGPRPSQPTGAPPSEQDGRRENRVSIGPEQYEQTVPARLHDIVAVNLKRSGAGWRVEFDRSVLEYLGPPESLAAPGAEGWSFRCVGTGTSELVLAAPAAPCPAGAVCPPASFEFRARVAVKE